MIYGREMSSSLCYDFVLCKLKKRYLFFGADKVQCQAEDLTRGTSQPLLAPQLGIPVHWTTCPTSDGSSAYVLDRTLLSEAHMVPEAQLSH